MTILTLTRPRVASLLAALWTWIKQRHEQRQDRALLQNVTALDDHMLKDIGITRNDVIWASQLPLSQNAAQELEKLSRRNRGQI